MEGDRIKLAKNDPQAGGQHHYIPTDWVERVVAVIAPERQTVGIG